jgi:hypothetical protein
MRNPIPEALLEMHYFHALRDHYASLLGTSDFHIFKPSTRIENWYGFDQGYFSSPNSTSEIKSSLRAYLHSKDNSLSYSLRAFFLQFKVVDKVLRTRSGSSPDGWTAPYYRSELSLDPSKETGMSQHETLIRAATIAGSTVAYVCPMIFTEDDVKNDAQISDLQFVDVLTAPSGWATNQKHHICFQETDSTPEWCSDPVEGKLIESNLLLERTRAFTEESFEEYLNELTSNLTTKQQVKKESNPLPSCMTVIATPIKKD